MANPAASVSAGGFGQAGLRQIVQQAGVIFVDIRQRTLDIPERRVQNQLNDAPLFVLEERSERVVDVAVVAIDEANHIGEVGPLHVLRRLCREGIESPRVLCRVRFHGRRDVLIAKVQDCKAEAAPLPVIALVMWARPRASRPRPEV